MTKTHTVDAVLFETIKRSGRDAKFKTFVHPHVAAGSIIVKNHANSDEISCILRKDDGYHDPRKGKKPLGLIPAVLIRA